MFSKSSTSLWFWNTEIGWAVMHPFLVASGWEYIQLIVWDKGLAHVAGNINGKTIRQLPVVTEVSALYRRSVQLPGYNGQMLPVKEWLRSEWLRSGLPLCNANIACDTKNAATRKYLTSDSLWYWPSGEAVKKMATYCQKYGKRSKRPYFSIDGINEITAQIWDDLKPVWNHENGITNVWSRPPLSNKERIKGTLKRSAPRTYSPSRFSATHLNQKPIDLMKRQILATSNAKDPIWEPFGGLASASVAALLCDRIPFVAEIDNDFAIIANERISNAKRSLFNLGI